MSISSIPAAKSRFAIVIEWARRILLLGIAYSILSAASFYLAYAIRFDFAVDPAYDDERLHQIVFVIVVKLVVLVGFRQIRSMLTYFSVPDVLRLGTALTVASLLLLVPRFVGHIDYSPPRGVILVDLLLSLTAFCGLRLGFRMYRERITMGRKLAGAPLERIVIIGAGDAGASLANDLINMPARGFRPVAFFDDNPKKHRQSIHGIPVLGIPERMPQLVDSWDEIKRVIIAMPSAPPRRVREIALFFAQKGYKVETLPALEELASGRVRVSHIRPVEVEDLLGRQPVTLDLIGIRKFIEGRVVMVTGAGGSIGSELCRQITHFNPSRLLLVEQSEPSLFLIEQEIIEAGMGALVQPLVADILDGDRMDQICAHFRPNVIFHAAAHKHVFLMERQPAEAIRNNSVGTRLLAEIAAKHGVDSFVMISTDKAINPTSLMGASKRLAEIHLQALQANNHTTTKFIMVRFGNVLGSSGSVVPIFKKQIAAGGPVTVTHPDVTRYFMTIPEAAGLVMQASLFGKGGEIFVLDMGEPIKIVDLARQMIELSGFKVGVDIEIKYSGLKSGEKLYEELQHCDERNVPTGHPRIMRFIPNGDARSASAKSAAGLEGSLYTMSHSEIKEALKILIPEYTPSLD